MTNARILAGRLADLLRREHVAMADFLVALAEFDRCRAWVELGHSSLFYFLHRDLGLSAGAAHYRKTAADLVQRFPEIIEPLRDGRLCITSVVQLAKVLTPENRHEMLPRFFQRSKREAMAIAAAILPAEAVPRRDIVTRLSGSFQPVEMNVRCSTTAENSIPSNPEANAVAPLSSPAPAVRRDVEAPLTGNLSRLHITVSRRFLEKLEKTRAALSHSRFGATTEDVLEAGLDLVLERHAKRKGLVKKPRRGAHSNDLSILTAAVKREVWTRDDGRCQWPVESGGICGSTLRVEFDHRVPRAHGGSSTAENVRLLCRMHNDLAARLAFGHGWMDQFTGKLVERSAARADVVAAPAIDARAPP
jgi:hypothetical protein